MIRHPDPAILDHPIGVPAYRWTAAKWAMEGLCLAVIFLLIFGV